MKLGNLIHETNQVGQLLNVVMDVHFESEAAEKQQILILLNDRRAVRSGFNGRKWKHSKEFGILYEEAYIPDTFESRKSIDLLVENCQFKLHCHAVLNPEKKRRKEAKPSPGSFQIHNAITGSWPKGNLQVFKEASKKSI
ncbi:hypothetical protein T4E_2758 [Trichinella pseudospiralis]|uniref:Uncharacterized protein n=1 Tax=Trichinella pseudospiralis TaxID=6337 RepID=A0A0V0XNJ8_TRIPS|nr:hypothetical protein T4E_2758 [Trichinella pseudospiralis]